MTAWERLQLLVGGFGEEQTERALELLSPLTRADARPDQQVRQLPAFLGIGDSGHSDISEHAVAILLLRCGDYYVNCGASYIHLKSDQLPTGLA